MAGLNGATGSSITTPNNGSASAAASFLEFAGNNRYQAYNLARFSTLSAVSSSATFPASSSRTSADSRSPGKSHDAQEGPSSSSHASRAHSNPAEADIQSPLSPSMGSSLSSSSSSSTGAQSGISSSASAPTSTRNYEDKDDDWAINESYSGHGGQTYSPRAPSIPPPGTSTNTSSDGASQDDQNNDDEDIGSRTKLQPSLSSFKSPSDIERSWRRTSDTLSSSSNSSVSPTLSASLASKAGGLDLSSSTLVQQMLFRDRAPHSDVEANPDGKQTKNEGNHAKDNALMSKDDAYDNLKEDEGDRDDYGNHLTEQKREDLIQRDQVAVDKSIAEEASGSGSPSLASMLLNSTAPSLSSSTDEATHLKPNKTSSKTTQDKTEQQEEEDHISRLDIRVGIVRSVSGHPDADSLYIEQVDVGDKEGDQPKEARTIVSGLVRHVPKEYLEGRAVIVVANMKPSKLRGVLSQGMLLCAMEQEASGEVTKVALLEPAEGSEAGDKVTIEGFTDEDTVPAAVLTPKRKWFEKSRVHFSVQDGVAYYRGSPFRTVKGLVRCRSISKGQIS
ncbi:hypothetical protein KVV02_003041 [Mortierella alpina]|uniref:tRNA-binding domain-containing protein n=1 Tax=Mortierella alpina TaxID=64518 RepID=A0A9P8A508_MORAP|nr:hypothetical protein KVV02_003041 [Mortierella alpina]